MTLFETPEQMRRGNMLLGRLRAPEWRLLAPHMEDRACRREETLFAQGEQVTHCWFPVDAMMVSLRVGGADGATCEVCTIGREGAAGGMVSNGRGPAFTSAVVATSGSCLRIPIQTLRQCRDQNQRIQNLFACYADCLLAQIMQATACNALHDLEQRIARWLLAFQDRYGGPEAPVTQEAMAAALGVGRPYASQTLKRMSRKGLLGLRRGAVIISDRAALEQASCACYEAVRGHFAAVIEGLYPDASQEALDQRSAPPD